MQFAKISLMALVGFAIMGCASQAPMQTPYPSMPASPAPAPATAPAPIPVPTPTSVPAPVGTPRPTDLFPPSAEAVIPPGLTNPAPNAGTSVNVWYATNRQITAPFKLSDPYTTLRDDKLNYGIANVWVPENRRRGSMGSIWGEITRKNQKVKYRRSDPMLPSDFWPSLASKLKTSPEGKVVLVFIHGYNVNFVDATKQTAQLWHDLRLQGAPVLFSWPSKADPKKYILDEASVEYSELHLEKFLVALRNEVGSAQPIHVIAHSMGNRALLRVAERVQKKLNFGQIILAAPDIDADLFHHLAQHYGKISTRTTIYVAKNDLPVSLSKQIHGADRVGAPPYFIQIPGIDTVEVVASKKLYEMGHSYYAEFNPMIDEIEYLFKNNPKHGAPIVTPRVSTKECAESEPAYKIEKACWRISKVAK